MLSYRLRVWLIPSVLLCLTACSKVNVSGPAGPPGPDGPAGDTSVAGPIFGRVFLYDSTGSPVSDNSGVSVVFENASPAINLSSQADGSFSVADAQAGVYNISFSKAGYGTMKLFRFEHTGGVNASQTGRIEMGQQLSSAYDIKKLEIDTVSFNQLHQMIVTITLAHPQTLPDGKVVLYAGSAPGTSKEHHDDVIRKSYSQTNDSTLVLLLVDLNPSVFSDRLLQSNFLYLRAAIDNPRLFTYTDDDGTVFYPASGNLSNEVKVYNNFKN